MAPHDDDEQKNKNIQRLLPNTGLTRFNKIATPNNKFQVASGQGSHWLIESPTILIGVTKLDTCQV